MGFPTRMFTVLFAIGRLPGWIAQWHEMIRDQDTRIGRPRQLYTGAAERDVRRRWRSADPVAIFVGSVRLWALRAVKIPESGAL